MDTTTRLRAAREAAKQLQEDLAEASGVPQGTISRIENGTAPQVVTALRLARALDTTVEDLFSDLLIADDEERARRAAGAVAPAAAPAPTAADEGVSAFLDASRDAFVDWLSTMGSDPHAARPGVVGVRPSTPAPAAAAQAVAS